MYKIQSQGFTLIELIVVIILLGVLAVTAAPKFIDFSSDARKATLSALEASVKTANKLAFSYGKIKNVANANNQDVTFPNGNVVRLDYGYPEHDWNSAWQYLLEGGFTLESSGGLCDVDTDWCVDSEFNISADVSIPGASAAVVFWPNGVDTADDCYVYYAFSTVKGNEPSIGQVNSGC